MEIKVKIELAPGRVWPFEGKCVYFLYTSDDVVGKLIVSLPKYNHEPQFIKCRNDNIREVVADQMLLTLGKFVNEFSPDHPHFDLMVRALEPILSEFPTMYVGRSREYRIGKVVFDIVAAEVAP